ncbi:MAG: hypothetical protein ACYCOR_18120 [Acidobacteriaceae bacterium]
MRRLPISLAAVPILFAAVLCASPSAHADRHRKYKPPPPMAKMTVTVLRAADGKPLKNAAVVFHPALGDSPEGNMELKTNDEGVATLSIVPQGSQVLVQVIMPGYRTFGQKYDVPGSEKSITIKLLPPDRQYSIYKEPKPSSDMQNNAPKTQMGHAEPADSPLLEPAPKKKN